MKRTTRFVVFSVVALLGWTLRAESLALPVVFERNHGQTDPETRFLARGSNWAAALQSDRVLIRQGDARWTLRFEGSNARPEIAGEEGLASRSGYFFGSREEWLTDVAHYGSVRYREVYPGIDMVFRTAAGRLEYDLHVAPGVSLEQARLRLEGVDRIELSPDGELVLKTPDGEVRQAAPRAFQPSPHGADPVEASFFMEDDGSVRFAVGEYDRGRLLVVDPLIYSTFFGGSGSVLTQTIAVADDGSVILAGRGGGVDFPVTEGQSAQFGAEFFAKIDPSKSGREALIYSAFMQGIPSATFETDSNGLLYMAATSGNGGGQVVTDNALQTEPAGFSDAYVAAFDFSGARPELVYATYFGGSAADRVTRLHLDSLGRIVLLGNTQSQDLPRNSAVFDATCPSSCEWAAVIDPALGTDGLVMSTFLPLASHSAVDSRNRIHVAGQTFTRLLPTPRGFRSDCQDDGSGSCSRDAYYVMMDPAAAEPVAYATYFGGSRLEETEALTVDARGRAWFGGATSSSDFPETVAPMIACEDDEPNCAEFRSATFIVGIDPDQGGGASRVFAARLGGNSSDNIAALAVVEENRVVAAGRTRSSVFPATADAFSSDCLPVQFGCRSQILFLADLDPTAPSGRTLRYATLLGGGDTDSYASVNNGRSPFFAEDGSLVAVVQTRSRDFPTTPGAFDRASSEGAQRISSSSNRRTAVLRFDTRRPGQAGLVYSSYVGGPPGVDSSWATAYRNDRLYLAASTQDPTLPTTPNAFDRTCAFGQVDNQGLCPGNTALTIFDLNPGATLAVEPAVIELDYLIPDPVPDAIPVEVRSSDPSARITLEAESNGDWLSVAPTEIQGDAVVSVLVDPSRLAGRATLTGRVLLESEAPLLRRSITVRLNVTASDPGPIRAVLNAASFEDRSIAPGQIVSIFGSNFGSLGGLSTGVNNDRIPQITGTPGTGVFFGGQFARALFARHDQINVVVPYGVAGERLVNVTVRTGAGTSPGFGVTVAPTAPALFTLTGTGTGQAAALNQDGSLNGSDRPASPGSVVTLFGTGEGATDPPRFADQIVTAPLPQPLAEISVQIGGRSAEVLYAGPAPGFTGLMQINVRLPEGLSGDALPVVVRADDGVSPASAVVAVR